MSRGGARKGAGRKKSAIEKKMCTFRLTEDERAFMKDALAKYRKGEAMQSKPAPAPNVSELPRHEATTIVYQGYSGAGLLAHLEDLYSQEYGWLQEYKKYLKSDYYDKHTLDEINLQRELIRLQIVALLPHLNHFHFDYDVKLACSPKGKAYISASKIPDIDKDIEIKAWQEPDGLDYQEENLRLAKMYRELNTEREKVRELERKQNDW